MENRENPMGFPPPTPPKLKFFSLKCRYIFHDLSRFVFGRKKLRSLDAKSWPFPLTFCVESSYRELETFSIFGKGLSSLSIELAMINIIISVIAASPI